MIVNGGKFLGQNQQFLPQIDTKNMLIFSIEKLGNNSGLVNLFSHQRINLKIGNVH